MDAKRRRKYVKLIRCYLDEAREKLRTVEGRFLLSRYKIALNGTRSHPEVVAVAGYAGLVEGYTQSGRFRYESALEELGQQLQWLQQEFDGELLVLGSEEEYDEEKRQFLV